MIVWNAERLLIELSGELGEVAEVSLTVTWPAGASGSSPTVSGESKDDDGCRKEEIEEGRKVLNIWSSPKMN